MNFQDNNKASNSKQNKATIVKQNEATNSNLEAKVPPPRIQSKREIKQRNLDL